MADRYFVETPIAGDRARLLGPEAHHLIHVMRAKIGTEVTLFDGSGSEFPAQVERLGRSEVELTVAGGESIDRELTRRVILAVALPKGERQRWLVEKAVELGVARLVPLRTERSVAQPVQQALVRLRRTVVEASKQCGRNRLMEVAEPESWADYLSATRDAPCRILAHPQTGAPASWPVAGDCMHLAVGPEGGLTDDEVAAAQAVGWQAVDLGPRILRVETAAVLLAAMVAGA